MTTVMMIITIMKTLIATKLTSRHGRSQQASGAYGASQPPPHRGWMGAQRGGWRGAVVAQGGEINSELALDNAAMAASRVL